MSTAFRKLQVLPPDLQKLKVAIGFPKIASKYTLWKVDHSQNKAHSLNVFKCYHNYNRVTIISTSSYENYLYY